MITAQLVDAVSHHASYQSMVRLDPELSQLGGGPDAALPRELQALASQFTLVTPPTLGTRLRAALSRLPLVGWLVPGGRQAQAGCALHDQRLRNVQALLVGQRAFLRAEYGTTEGIHQALAGSQEAARRLVERRVEDFRLLDVPTDAIEGVREISRAVIRYTVAARGVYEFGQTPTQIARPLDDPRALRTYVYGALSHAIEHQVIPYFAGTQDVVEREGRPELRADLRNDLVRGFRQWIQAEFERSPRAPTPSQVDASLHAYLRSMDLVPAHEAPAPVHHLQLAPRVVREGKQGHGGGGAEDSGVVIVHMAKRSESH